MFTIFVYTMIINVRIIDDYFGKYQLEKNDSKFRIKICLLIRICLSANQSVFFIFVKSFCIEE